MQTYRVPFELVVAFIVGWLIAMVLSEQTDELEGEDVDDCSGPDAGQRPAPPRPTAFDDFINGLDF